ncbi:transmembrane protein 187 [Denticeps clupeoides]|uniref:Transmembrane protein 187 n=1 Tax=Denticeps clupeoides TaxID=299321 RepID=A0AAY4A2L7_9TELE|nr:transmembrane protein 187 [Denticeps clupeoides]
MQSAALHVLLPACLCAAVANSALFDEVSVDLTYEHYAEARDERLPAFLAMPFNCLVNLGYVVLGVAWLLKDRDRRGTAAGYSKDVFASMAVAYGPVQWLRLASLRRAPGVLDQWFTLPIFAWVPAWCRVVERGWRTRYALLVEGASLLSYALALLHRRGFEAALAGHVAFAVAEGFALQRRRGDGRSLRYLLLAVLCCGGFVLLKVLDHALARHWAFQHLTGHFWSKVCDILQFHYSLSFLSYLHQKKTEDEGKDS